MPNFPGSRYWKKIIWERRTDGRSGEILILSWCHCKCLMCCFVVLDFVTVGYCHIVLIWIHWPLAGVIFELTTFKLISRMNILGHKKGVGGAVRFLVVGTIGQWGKTTSSGWSSVWHRSNTGLSSTQYEQIPIILGVWPFWLTLFFFRSIIFWRAYG